MNKVLCIIIAVLVCTIATKLPAQTSNPLDDMLLGAEVGNDTVNNTTNQDSLTNDIIRVNYAKKNAQLAMIMSAIVPGAGQFYVDPSAITAYIFPILELAVIGGIIYYNNQGDKKTKEYKKYVMEDVTIDVNGYTYTGPRYRRDFQNAVQDTLISIHSADIYDGIFFSLDNIDSQHFFEDIGKYDKYVFGWVDWYFKYAELPPITGLPDPHPVFVFDIDNPANPYFNSSENKWRYNIPLTGEQTQDLPYSALRSEYIKMRQAAEDKYRVANYMSFGIAANHILSAIDANRLARKVNKFYLSGSNVKLNYYAAYKNGHLTPMIGMNVSF